MTVFWCGDLSGLRLVTQHRAQIQSDGIMLWAVSEVGLASSAQHCKFVDCCWANDKAVYPTYGLLVLFPLR